VTNVTRETLSVYACTNVEAQLTNPVGREIDPHFDTKINVLGHRLAFSEALSLAAGLRAVMDEVLSAVETHNKDIEQTFYSPTDIEKDLTDHG